MRSILGWQRVVVALLGMGALVAASVCPAKRAAAQEGEDAPAPMDGPGPAPMDGPAPVNGADPIDDVGPSTFTLDRMDANTRLGLQVGFDKLADISLGDGFAMRFEPYGQFVFPSKLVGIYGALPIARIFDFTDGSASGTGVGNVDVGGFFMPFQRSNLILRAGVALPTASEGQSAAANFATGFERVTDVILIAPNYTSLRLSGSTVQESGQMFVRADFGLDVAVDKPAGGSSVFGRVNVAAGVRLKDVDLAAELANLGALDGEQDVPDRFFHTLALGLRTRGADQFHAGLVFPLDANTRGEIWILSLGYQRAMK